jgi:hypothetical protein
MLPLVLPAGGGFLWVSNVTVKMLCVLEVDITCNHTEHGERATADDTKAKHKMREPANDPKEAPSPSTNHTPSSSQHTTNPSSI